MCNGFLLRMSQAYIVHRGILTQPLERERAVGRGVRPARAFSQVPDGRLYALDLARFMAMVFMMQGHVLDALVSSSVIDVSQAPWNLWHWVRGLTAPVFLMVSGAVHVFASKRGANGAILPDVLAKRVRWAITIIGLGYLLYMPANRVWDLPFVPQNGWQQFYAVNILQLTGVALLAFILIMASTKSVNSMGRRALVTGVAILALSPVTSSQWFIQSLPGWLAAYFTTSAGSLFPVFPFASFLFFGVALGAYLRAVPAEFRDDQLYRLGITVGAVVAMLAFLLHHVLIANGVEASLLESPVSPLLAIRRLGIVLMIFSAAVVLLRKTYRYRNWYVLFGTRSLYIYVIHLVLLYGTPWFDSVGRTQFRSLGLPGGIVVMMSIMVSTLFIAWAIDRYERSEIRPSIKMSLRVGAYALGVWLLFF